jgi:hypothetical protein
MIEGEGGNVTKPLVVPIGTYRITKYEILDTADNVLYRSPDTGSARGDLGQLVAKGMPLTFTVAEDSVSLVKPQVLEVLPQHNSEDFGLQYIRFDTVPTFFFDFSAIYYDTALVPDRFRYIDGIINVQMIDSSQVYRYSFEDTLSTIRVLDYPDVHYALTVVGNISSSLIDTLSDTLTTIEMKRHVAGEPNYMPRIFLMARHFGVSNMTILGDSILLRGDSTQLSAAVTTIGGASQRVFWSSENPSIATVDTNGVVVADIGVLRDSVEIVATSVVDSSKQAVQKIQIYPPILTGLQADTTILTTGNVPSFNSRFDLRNSVWAGGFTTDGVSGTQVIFETGGGTIGTSIAINEGMFEVSSGRNNNVDLSIPGVLANTTYSYVIEFDITGQRIRAWLKETSSPQNIMLGAVADTDLPFSENDLSGSGGAGYGQTNGAAQGGYSGSFGGVLDTLFVYHNQLLATTVTSNPGVLESLQANVRFTATGNYSSFNNGLDTQNAVWAGSFNANSVSGTQVLFETGGGGTGTAIALREGGFEISAGTGNNVDLSIPGILANTTYSYVIEFNLTSDTIEVWLEEALSPEDIVLSRTADTTISFTDNDLSGSNGAGYGQANSGVQGNYVGSFTGTLGTFSVYYDQLLP